MIGKNKPSRRSAAGRKATGVTIALVLLVAFVFTQMISAAQNDGTATPPPNTFMEEMDFSQESPTTDELLAMPPSIERYIAAHTLPAGVLQPAELESSSKSTSAELVSPNTAFYYTIDVVNSGEVDIPAEVTDVLPAAVTYLSHECPPLITNACSFEEDTLEWQGTVPDGETVTISIQVRMNGDSEPGTTVVNTAQIVSAEQDLEVEAEVTVDSLKASPIQFLPFTIYGLSPDPGPVNLTVGEPNSGNTWTLTWTESVGATGYQYEEADNPDFNGATAYNVGPVNTASVTREPSPWNIYYYRVRSIVGDKVGPWSNTGSVIGGYYDDFEEENTGWTLRRSTYREKVHGFYENGKYVMQVLDRWDWGLASPLMPAPRVPYAIEFEMRIVAPANLLSAGMVFGGDWNGATCPPGISYDEWYTHENCFNHFYNTNTIFFGDLKMLFERVDELVWCPNCDGSPMKRIGDIDPGDERVLSNVDPEGWNHYRVEVREDGIKFFAAKRGDIPKLQFEYDDTRWIDSPYFGFFASTDEYNNSTWRFEYMQVMPLDN